ncbi:MAG: tetratricopeptide repeat protein [Novosphingobium sp.]|nr:tetratricopeptide repeat protein [Novosphingobium sp.]
MRYFPAALALSLLAGVSGSMGVGATPDPAPRAAQLIAEGNRALQSGNAEDAANAFEAALAVDPAYTPTLLHLASAARANGLNGKAIHYYREVLKRSPANLAALAGEGEAMMGKGAVEKARRNLAKLESLCGTACDETRKLAASIETGPATPVLTAEAVTPDVSVTQN